MFVFYYFDFNLHNLKISKTLINNGIYLSGVQEVERIFQEIESLKRE